MAAIWRLEMPRSQLQQSAPAPPQSRIKSPAWRLSTITKPLSLTFVSTQSLSSYISICLQVFSLSIPNCAFSASFPRPVLCPQVCLTHDVLVTTGGRWGLTIHGARHGDLRQCSHKHNLVWTATTSSPSNPLIIPGSQFLL